MSTSRSISTLTAVAVFALASASVALHDESHAADREAVVSIDTKVEHQPLQRRVTVTRPRLADSEPSRYRWPVKPFDRQHPVRGFFGDPRIGNHGASRQFHFGIDISAANGTPVYATLDGTAFIHPLHSTTVAIVGADGVELSYWHLIPAIRTGQRVVAYETVIGRIEAPYGHVHFSEKRDGRYLNPLRPGAIGPFVDGTRPVVRSLVLRDGLLVAEAYDETPLAIPRPWQDLPVMPAIVRWRVLDLRGGVVRGWTTAVDFRRTIPAASAFDRIWAPGVTQNHVRAPGHFRLALSVADDLGAGRYEVEVAASDVRGNATRSRFEIDLSGS